VTCTWAGATTPMGNRSATIVVLVAANVANGTNLSATATASSATTDPNAANNAATATTAVIAQADIAMTAFTDSPDPVTAGTNLTYQVAMINNGASDAQNARFSLPLPAGTSFVSAAPSAGGNCTNVSPVTCTWAGATAPTVSRSATIVVLVAPSVLQGTTLNATVTGSSDTTDPVAGNNTLATSTAVIALADLQIGLTASVPTADLGQTVTFTATSTNGGPSDAQNVVLSITLSPDFRYGSHTASAGAVCTTPQIGNSGVISCTWAGATAPGVVRTLAVNAASFSPGTSSIQAATSSNTTDPVPTSNNVASVSVLVGNPVEPIPTLSQWSLMLLGLLVGLIGVALVRRD
jgi:large repetitive protein